MRKKSISAIAVAIACASLAACASNEKAAKNAAAAPIQGPYLPAGTEFAASLQRELGTAASPTGTTFEARVKNNLTTPDGQILVMAGAPVSGRVVDVRRGVEPSIKLNFDKITTVRGDVPIAATVTSAQEYAWIDREAAYNPAAGYEARLYHPIYHPGYVPPKPVPPGTNPQVIRSGEIVLPEGLELTLTLMAPLLGPTAGVKPAG
jgi:hypothetical protein